MKWRFINSGFAPGPQNMAIDRQLARDVGDGLFPATLRVYGWQPAAISIGFHQSESDFDLAKIQRDGLDLVRRPTGGKAILHAQEVTYAVAVPAAAFRPRVLYEFINRGICAGLRQLGVNAVLTSEESNVRDVYRSPMSIPCFGSSAKSEIQVDGRKLVGSAQRRMDNAVLQHGSILLGTGHRDITRYFATDRMAMSAVIQRELANRTIELETLLRHSIAFSSVVAALRSGFQEVCGIEFVEDILAPVEIIPQC